MYVLLQIADAAAVQLGCRLASYALSFRSTVATAVQLGCRLASYALSFRSTVAKVLEGFAVLNGLL